MPHDNGDTVYWVKDPSDEPDSWTITGNAARNTNWPCFSSGLAAFLYVILSGRLSLPIFPTCTGTKTSEIRTNTTVLIGSFNPTIALIALTDRLQHVAPPIVIDELAPIFQSQSLYNRDRGSSVYRIGFSVSHITP